MILRLGSTSDQVVERFDSILPELLPHHDTPSSGQNFELKLKDCWEALCIGDELDWVDFDGGFDLEEYEHYDDPRHADLHVVVPNKLVAMKGPIDLPEGRLWQDTPQGTRD